MFTFAATPIKFVGLLVLFTWCVVWGIAELARPASRDTRVSQSLHLLMSVVMLAMVPTVIWMPIATAIPPLAWAIVFGLATVWFITRILAASSRPSRMHSIGCTLMFGAMTWHLAAMTAKRAAMASGTMPGKGAAPSPMMMTLAWIGLPFMIALLVMGLNDLRRVFLPRAASEACACGEDCSCGADCTCGKAVPVSLEVASHVASKSGMTPGGVIAPATVRMTCHVERPVGSVGYRLDALAGMAMNLGMFWMSTGLMVPLLPFMSVFAI